MYATNASAQRESKFGRVIDSTLFNNNSIAGFDAQPQVEQPIQSPFKPSAGVDHSLYHPQNSWAVFRQDKKLIDDEPEEAPNSVAANADDVYSTFISYFGDMNLVKCKLVHNYAVYSTPIYGMTNDKRYIFVIVPDDNNQLGSEHRLSELRWSSFQTRTLREEYPGTVQDYPATLTGITNMPIKFVREVKDEKAVGNSTGVKSVYHMRSVPLQIELLSKARSNRGYADVGTLAQALETFNTVVTMLAR